LPAAGVVQAVSATAKEAECSLTRRPSSFGGGRAGHLLDDQRRGRAPAPSGPGRVLDRDVVVDQHRLDPYPFIAGEIGRHLEVQYVAGVVLHDVHDTGATVDRLGRGQDLVRHRRREHLARARRVEHAGADESAVQRLVTGAAAGDEPDLAGLRRVHPYHDLVGDIDTQVGVGRGDSGERLPDNILGSVDELLHDATPSRVGCWTDAMLRAVDRTVTNAP
jgi:hypothetical protein